MKLAGAVLAGGASRRMGRAKAFIQVDGRPMVHRVADALVRAGADPVVVIGGDAARLHALGLDVVADRHAGEGPLGAIITALAAADGADAVAVLACDLLEPSPAEVRHVAAALPGHDVAVPAVDGLRQWAHAVWSPAALSALEAAFAAGERAPRRAVSDLAVVDVVVDDPHAYADADTPDDLPPGATH